MTKLKRKSAIIVTAIALFAAALLALPGEKLWNDKWGGTVSAATIDPKTPSQVDGVYQIGTAEELYGFANLVNEGNQSASAVLTANIVVNANASADDSTIWYPIENYGGTFDGQGHTISGLNIVPKSENYCGLFAKVGFTDEYYQYHSSTVKNLGVINSFIKQTEGKYGMICGENNGTILNCYSTGTITDDGNIGGICGENSEKGKIINCYSSVSVSGGSKTTGGICGVNSLEAQDNIENCYSTYRPVGNNNFSPDNKVESKSDNDFSRGEVAFLLSQGEDGEIWGQNQIDESYDDYVYYYPVLNGKKVYKYCNGDDTYTIVESERHDYTETADDGSSKCTCGAIGLVEAQKIDDVYQISNASELYWFSDRVKNDNANFGSSKAVLTADITVNENVLDENGNLNSDKTFIEWMPIGTPLIDNEITLSFSGTFDGQNHVISGLYYSIDTPSTVYKYAGLFSTIRGGTVMNVGVVDSYFHAATRSGGITGSTISKGTIKNCYSNCYVEGTETGGIAGEVCASNITNCYSLGNVKGISSGNVIDNVGGICGSNYGNLSSVINCYSSANVEGNGTLVGGIAGSNYSTIKNCYYNTNVYTGNAIGKNSGTVEDVSGMTESDFKRGEVAYLLSHGEEDGYVYGQDLSKDKLTSFCDKKVVSSNRASLFSNECMFYGKNVALDGTINLNVYIAASPDFTNWQLKIAFRNADSTTFKAEEAKKIGNDLYKFTIAVAPKDISNTFNMKLLDSNSNEMANSTSSVNDYLIEIIDNPEFESQHSIAQALLDYGNAAKAYFDENGTVEPVEGVTADDLKDYSMNFNSSNMPEGVEYVGSTLLLNHATTLRHYFKFSDSVTPRGFKINDSSAEPKQFEGDSSIYYIDTDPIIASELSYNQTISINGNVIMSNCSVLTYAKSVLDDKDSSENLKNLVKTIYNYHQAATAYSESLNENL